MYRYDEFDQQFVAQRAAQFRRQVKRHGGCGLVVTEMVSSEGLIRGMDRTLEYAEFTEENPETFKEPRLPLGP